MKITRRDNRALVIVDFPYLIGAIAFPAVVFLLYHAVAALRRGGRTGEVVGAGVGALLFFTGGALFTQRNRFEFDLVARRLTWSRRGLFTRACGTVPFDRLRHAAVQTLSSGGGGSGTHRVVLVLTDGGELPLTRAYDADREAAERARTAINEVLGALATGPDDDIRSLARAGRTIDAIALARTHYGYDLARAKEFVEALIK